MFVNQDYTQKVMYMLVMDLQTNGAIRDQQGIDSQWVELEDHCKGVVIKKLSADSMASHAPIATLDKHITNLFAK